MLALTTLSPWNFFASTRTLSNGLETWLTVAAFVYWPAQWALPPAATYSGAVKAEVDDKGLRIRDHAKELGVVETKWTFLSLVLQAFATLLRPTSLLNWLVLFGMTILSLSSANSKSSANGSGAWATEIPWITAGPSKAPRPAGSAPQNPRVVLRLPTFGRATKVERTTLVRLGLLAGAAVLALTTVLDFIFYRRLVFPPLAFLYYNLVQGVAGFYGLNDWHYYFSQGLPLMLTTALPFALLGLIAAVITPVSQDQPLRETIFKQLAAVVSVMIAALSLIPHKEVRFIYPLLPLLHILAGPSLVFTFLPCLRYPLRSRLAPRFALLHRAVLAGLIALNIGIGVYTTTVHNSGVLEVLSYLRTTHETSSLPRNQTLSAAFLMPCHSTPWRSHLIHPSIHAWALTCEPPLNMNSTEKAAYVDEADAFYADPGTWLKGNMARQQPRKGTLTINSPFPPPLVYNSTNPRPWPEYLLFFSPLTSPLTPLLKGSAYTECARFFNSHWHDDARRQGDVVVWCLDPKRGRSQHELEVMEERERARRRTEKTENVLGGGRGPWGIAVGQPAPKKTASSTEGGRLQGLINALWPAGEGAGEARRRGWEVWKRKVPGKKGKGVKWT